MSLRRQALGCRGGNGGSSRLGLKCPGRGRKRRKAAGEKPQRRPRLQGPHHRRRNLQRQTSIKRSLRSAREASGRLSSGCGIEAARQAGPVCYWGSSRMVLIDSLVAGCRLKSSPSLRNRLAQANGLRLYWVDRLPRRQQRPKTLHSPKIPHAAPPLNPSRSPCEQRVYPSHSSAVPE